MAAEPERVVREFCAAWGRKNIDELLGFFTSDAVYHNMPLEPVRGVEAIRQTFEMFAAPADKIEFEMLALASAGNVVFTERVDRFWMLGQAVALPVAGVFEVRGGKIAAWRDYFDMQTWMKQTQAA